MKKLIVVLLVLFAATAMAQPLHPAERGAFVKQWATYGSSTGDTTGYISMIGTMPIKDLKEVGLLFTATDSVQAAVYVIGKNSKILVGTVAPMPATYTDSISTILWLVNGHTALAARPYFKAIMLKDATVNRLSGCDAFKVGVVFTAASSDRAARVTKLYLWGKE